jgi:FHS family glucose/mannose:H+ symporter-like MFS transporter
MPLSKMFHSRARGSRNWAAHAAFLPIGVVTVLLGPLLPILSARWGLNYAQAGSLFTAQFLGSTGGVFASGFLVSRWGFRFAANAGLLTMAAGVGALLFGSRNTGLLCILIYGFGLGLAIPAINLYVAAANPARRSAALNLLNFYWSVGAVACPFVVAAAARVERIEVFLVSLAGFLLLVFFGIAAAPKSFDASVPSRSARVDRDRGSIVSLSSRRHMLILLAALFFLYVGAENGFGGWIASYAETVKTASLALPVLMPSFFYAALMLGRWIAPFLLRSSAEDPAGQAATRETTIPETKLARFGLLLGSGGMAGLLISRTMPLVAVSAAVAGFGLAAVYPIIIARLSREFGPNAARVGSVMFTMANLGGAFLPWAVGFVSHGFHDLRVGLAVPLAAALAMCTFYPADRVSSAVQSQNH